MHKPDQILSVTGLRKTYSDGYVALRDIDVALEVGRSLAVVGGSGSGKSTLLRCVAGLEIPDTGSIAIGGREVFSSAGRFVPPERRQISMMFQDYALWPHMSVWQNVRYPLRKLADAEAIARRVCETLEMIGCSSLAKKYPAELSGGEQQRVALGRAIVGQPSLLLADEPFSNLDTLTRERIRAEFLATRQSVGFGLVHVTHDPREAMMLGDTVMVLSKSQLEDVGPPLRVYERPRSLVAAQALGLVNTIRGRVIDAHRQTDGGLAEVRLETDLGMIAAMAPGDVAAGASIAAVIRPIHVRVGRVGANDAEARTNRLAATVRFGVPLGELTSYGLSLANGELMRAESAGGGEIVSEGDVTLEISGRHVWTIPTEANTGPRGNPH